MNCINFSKKAWATFESSINNIFSTLLKNVKLLLEKTNKYSNPYNLPTKIFHYGSLIRNQ